MAVEIKRYTPIQAQKLKQLERACLVYESIIKRINDDPTEKRVMPYSDKTLSDIEVDQQFNFGVWSARRALMQDLVRDDLGDEVCEVLKNAYERVNGKTADQTA